MNQNHQNKQGRSQVLDFTVASTLKEVVDAWSLVHDAYTRIGLIDTNRFGLHTVPQAISGDTCVVLGCVNDAVVSTLAILPEGEHQIPLQHIYPDELNEMRKQGRRLLEVGLLADRREQMSRAMVAVFEMMRYVFWYALINEMDIIIGVHPHHAGFYIKSFGFESIGSPSTHPTVKGNPVQLLKLDLQSAMSSEYVPPRLYQYFENPLPDDAFDHRFDFDPSTMSASALGMYLDDRAKLISQIKKAS